MAVFPPKKKVGGPGNDFFFERFDKGLDLPRHPSERAGSGIVVITLLLVAAYILMEVL